MGYLDGDADERTFAPPGVLQATLYSSHMNSASEITAARSTFLAAVFKVAFRLVVDDIQHLRFTHVPSLTTLRGDHEDSYICTFVFSAVDSFAEQG
jgi:hypothetical protein